MRYLAFPVAAPAAHSLDFGVNVRLPAGVRFERFERNPVVLFGHNTDEAIGTVRELAVRDGILSGRVRLASERGARIVPKMREGLINFAELAIDDDGAVLELSLVGAFSPNVEIVSDADDAPHVLRDGEAFVPPDLICSCTPSSGCACRPFAPTPGKEPTMSEFDSSDSPMIAAHRRIAERERQGMPVLAFTKQGPTPGAFRPPTLTAFDGGNELELVAELRNLVKLAATGELSERGAKRGAEIFTALGKLFELTPDPPAVLRERDEAHSDAKDSPFVRAAARAAEYQRTASGQALAFNRDQIIAERDGGDVA
jgi:hypothetical protein